jgi:hypothetical protein
MKAGESTKTMIKLITMTVNGKMEKSMVKGNKEQKIVHTLEVLLEISDKVKEY